MKMEQTDCPETSAHKIQTSEYHPKQKNRTSGIRRKFEIKGKENLFILSDAKIKYCRCLMNEIKV
jgi:hypothetical protein